MEAIAEVMQQEQQKRAGEDAGGENGCAAMELRGRGEKRRDEDEEKRERGDAARECHEVIGGPAGGAMSLNAMIGVFPGVEEEAVERAGGSEEKGDRQEVEAELREARDGGDEDGGGEEDADGELFGETMGAVAGQRARVDDEEPCSEQCGQKRVDAHGAGVEGAEQSDEDAGGDGDEREKGAAVAMMEAVALFELRR